MRLEDISRRDTIILILITCFFAVLYASFDDPLYDVDQIGYVQGARNILHGRGYIVPKSNSLESLRQAADTDFVKPIEPPGYRKEIRPVLFGYVLAAFMRVAGPEVSRAALFSALCGVWSLILVYRIALSMGGTMAAVFAACLTGFSYFFWRASLSVMTESLATALSLTGAALFLAALRAEQPRLLVGAGAFYGLSVATRPQQIVLVVASAAAYLATRRGVRRKDFAALAMGGVLFVASLMPQYFYARSETLLYNRVRILALEYFWRGEGGDANRPPWQIFAYLKAFLLGGQLIFPLASPLLVAAAYLALRWGPWEGRFLLVWLAGVFALVSVELYFSLRYVAQGLVPAHLLMAQGLSGIRRHLATYVGPPRSARLIGILAIALVALTAFTGLFGVVTTVRVHNLRAAPFQYLRENSTPEDIVLGTESIGDFHSAAPFFLLDGSPGLLERVVGPAHRAGKHVFVVVSVRRAIKAENQFGSSVDTTRIRDDVERLGGRKIWEGASMPPLHRWLPSAWAVSLSEEWAVYAL